MIKMFGLVLLLSTGVLVDSFSIQSVAVGSRQSRVISCCNPRPFSVLRMADTPPPEEPAAPEASAEEESGEASLPDDSSAAASGQGEAVGEEEQAAPPPEDPAVTALKQEITNLESALKAKRLQVADMSDRADEMSQAGYARKVAEMENMRRARSVSSTLCEFVMAGCLPFSIFRLASS